MKVADVLSRLAELDAEARSLGVGQRRTERALGVIERGRTLARAWADEIDEEIGAAIVATASEAVESLRVAALVLATGGGRVS